MPRVNAAILKWARETAGFTLEAAAEKLGLGEARGLSAASRLAALETGEELPSRPLLVKMASRYHRPLLTFYLSEPPVCGDRGKDFRSVREGIDLTEEALLGALLRDVQARQGMVRAALEDTDEATPLPFVASMKMADGIQAVLASIRKVLQVDIRQFRAQATPEKAFGLLREASEAAGIFVVLRGNLGSYHTDITLQTFRGFALADPIAPFVVINSQESKVALSFTLLHELAHLWLGQTGVSGQASETAIERFCNNVAGEFLMPGSEISGLRLDTSADLETLVYDIDQFARRHKVSSSMVAYRLYQAETLDKQAWSKLDAVFQERWKESRRRQKERNQGRESGPSANVVDGYRLGNALLGFVDRMMGAGALTTSKAGKVLGVKGPRVQALLDTAGYGHIHGVA